MTKNCNKIILHGMLRAIISDIHSNAEAFSAVLEDIDKQGISEIICLGDVIGYGPDPRECIKLAMSFGICLRGNHEDALLNIAIDFNMDAAAAIDWTRNQLNDKAYPKMENHMLWNYLDKMVETKAMDDALFVHGSPKLPTREYIRPTDITDPAKMRGIFSMVSRLCFCGHTHEPGVFTEELKFHPPTVINGYLRFPPDKKYIINVGSVGQPRDRDNRACYATYDGDTVRFHRVKYDYEATMKKILEIPDLSPRLAYRLKEGR